ncbi:MAG: hypothetical protein A3J29_19310 [Acidobacteria bacterium RIFCSPLOWO2_12_FULL_67_14b]|nr:MAG: hypothetical protein A3J29_19310 [Acidobacteria bacterium RIFCSPLOWO2_12_FULL_67_14b]
MATMPAASQSPAGGGGRTLNIGMSLTATAAPAYAALGYGIQAYLQNRNDTTGGVNGYKFNINIVDNANTTQGGATSVRQLLSPKPDLLIVEATSPFVGSLNVLRSMAADIPTIVFADADKVKEAKMPSLFGTWPSYTRECMLLARYAVQTRKQTNLALLYIDNAVGQGASETCPAYMKKIGATKVTAIAIPLTTTSFASIAQKMKDSGAQGGVIIAYSPQTKGVQVAAVAMNYRPSWYGFSSLFDKNYLDLAGAAAEGTFIDSWVEPLSSDTAEVKAFTRAIRKYSPISETSLGSYGWTMGAVIVAALEQATKGGKPLTADSWMAALRQMDGLRAGLSPALTYKDDQSSVVRKVAIYQVKGGRFHAVAEAVPIPNP